MTLNPTFVFSRTCLGKICSYIHSSDYSIPLIEHVAPLQLSTGLLQGIELQQQFLNCKRHVSDSSHAATSTFGGP
ncbi:hypothetical protein QTG54_015551 [Skeletonema marinoi]|uniref:Uncharacterized protein n=1 Tax=Skeletonema marinoi TaxID=267567 RepID=A0AAD8XUP9_9STRA|nr:hypothetical protein QTG54_015551 [Skeletonema marinoi]